MADFVFILGNAPKLALAELRAVLAAEVLLVGDHYALARLPAEIDVVALQRRLGGVVKIAQVVEKLPADVDDATLLYRVSEQFLALNQEKLYLALGELGRDHREVLDVRELKTRLREHGLKVRFAECGRHGAGAALLTHQHQLQEMLVIATGEQVLLAHTRSAQTIDDWSWRDRSKPYADRRKGMLPPKLARMMVNLAGSSETERVLYDPFCGTGTVLLEAAELGGFRLYGSDLDVKAVLGTQENLEWWQAETGRQVVSKVWVSDVARARRTDLEGKMVDVIVTEPFLGRQTPQPGQLANIFRGLQKLYWGAFRCWSDLLADEAQVIIVMPRVCDERGREYSLDSLLDKLADLGYNKISRELSYARADAVVRREIAVFEFRREKR